VYKQHQHLLCQGCLLAPYRWLARSAAARAAHCTPHAASHPAPAARLGVDLPQEARPKGKHVKLLACGVDDCGGAQPHHPYLQQHEVGGDEGVGEEGGAVQHGRLGGRLPIAHPHARARLRKHGL
jgi:hypothetical protein